ncbi:hypothetical protein Tco_0119671 [Tanacetum coccineum]
MIVERRFPKANLPPQKRLCLTTPTPRFEVGESSTAAATRQPGLGAGRTTDYGFVDIVADAPRRHVTMEGRICYVDRGRALVSREAWAQAMGCSGAVHYELQEYIAHTQIHDLRISLQETFTATLVAQISSLQSQLIAAPSQIQALQVRDQAHVDDPEDADRYS